MFAHCLLPAQAVLNELKKVSRASSGQLSAHGLVIFERNPASTLLILSTDIDLVFLGTPKAGE